MCKRPLLDLQGGQFRTDRAAQYEYSLFNLENQEAIFIYFHLAPTIPPSNLSAANFYSLNSLPVQWIKVPPELTKGYILGYRLYLKLITVGLEEVPDARATEIVLKGQPSSYVFEGLDFFSKYQIYLIAYTVGGDSPRSNIIYAGEYIVLFISRP
jgi:hypothetical protein